MESNDELKILLPATELKCGNLTLKVEPFPFAKLPEVLSIIKNIGNSIYDILVEQKAGQLRNENGKVVGHIKSNFTDGIAVKIANLVTEHFEEVVALMAIYCRVDKTVFFDEKANFSVEDGILVILTILAIHKHFFIQRVMPMLKKVKQQ